jgi:hypothetical protein
MTAWELTGQAGVRPIAVEDVDRNKLVAYDPVRANGVMVRFTYPSG